MNRLSGLCFNRTVVRASNVRNHPLLLHRQPNQEAGHTLIRAMASETDGKGTEAGASMNRLGLEKSPYLLQHATNPVDWHPWGKEAFSKAKADDKPIFLSVGYSTCHWCHVMERESFENKDIAKVMNDHFVCVKVDREERPDVDRVYMSFVQATTGGGGWPMSVWLTPDLKPIVGGTYFPPDDRYYGRPGFKSVLINIALKWRQEREKLDEQGTIILDALMRAADSKSTTSAEFPAMQSVKTGFAMLQKAYDEEKGGFNSKPKFPQPVNLNFLFRVYADKPDSLHGQRALEMSLHTLKMMAKGGIHDHVAKGFHRYSTDENWHVPHFEKMLYDQAQLAVAYLDAYQITKEDTYADVARDILEYVSRDLSDKSGGFYSAEDADSLPSHDVTEKCEGAFCVWTANEIEEALGQAVDNHEQLSIADVFCFHYGIKRMGNVDPYQDPHDELKNKNVLIVRDSIEATAAKFCLTVDAAKSVLEKGRHLLYYIRKNRPRPHLDNKMLTAWNGLMISGFARAGQILGNKQYTERAVQAAEFLRTYMYGKDTGLLLRSAYAGDEETVTQIPVPIEGFSDDYAFIIRGLLDLHEASCDPQWLEWAESLQEKQDELFWDTDSGGYFNTGADDPTIVIRMKDDQDGAEPSANSVSAMNLLRLSSYLDRPVWRDQAVALLAAFAERLEKLPVALPEMVSALLFLQGTPKQIIIAGRPGDPNTEAMVRRVHSHFLPNKILIVADGDQAGFFYSRLKMLKTLQMVDGKATAYVCENYTCSLPVSTAEELDKLLLPEN